LISLIFFDYEFDAVNTGLYDIQEVTKGFATDNFLLRLPTLETGRYEPMLKVSFTKFPYRIAIDYIESCLAYGSGNCSFINCNHILIGAAQELLSEIINNQSVFYNANKHRNRCQSLCVSLFLTVFWLPVKKGYQTPVE